MKKKGGNKESKNDGWVDWQLNRETEKEAVTETETEAETYFERDRNTVPEKTER